MSARGLFAFACLLAGCGDPVVRISIDAGDFGTLPITLRVILPPELEPVTCQMLAFDPERLESLFALTERQATLGIDPFTFDALDRNSARVVIAEAIEDGPRRVGIACAELPANTDDRDLVLALEPTTLANFESGVNANDLIVIGVRDAHGMPLVDAPISWTVRGANDARTSGSAVGGRTVMLELPSVVGPVTAFFHSRFAIQSLPPLNGFVRGALAQHPITPDVLTLAKLGANGEFRLVRKFGADLLRCGGDALDDCVSMGIGIDAAATRLITLEDAEVGGGDALLVVGPGSWSVVHPNGTVDHWTAPPAIVPSRVFTADSCTELNFLFVAGEIGATAVARTGGTAPVFDGLQLLASGCVSTASGELWRTMVLFAPTVNGPLIHHEQNAPWLGPASAFSFARDPKNGMRSLLGVQLSLNQPVITRSIWAAEGSLASFATSPIPIPPRQLRAGDLDGDGALDIAAILPPPGSGEPCACDCSLWVALASGVGGSLPLTTACNPALFTGDVDGDGKDEVIVVSDQLAATVLHIGAPATTSR